MIIKWIIKEYSEAFVWIYLSQDRDQWPSVVSTVVILRATECFGYFLCD
jgi:hypothetical protein